MKDAKIDGSGMRTLVDRWKGIENYVDLAVDWLERHSRLTASAMLLIMLLIAVGRAAVKLLWYDELVTMFTANLPTWGDVWRFFADGLDTTGPVAAMVARVGGWAPLPPELSVRLPFMLAFLCMCLGIYVFLRRRYSAGYALAGLLLPLALPGLFYYMTEARAYALMLGGASLGMVFWQSAAEDRGRPWSVLGLWLALAFAIASHVFAFFLFVPFAAAQWFVDRSRKCHDWPVWLALLMFPAGYLPFVPGTLKASAFYRTDFHSKASLGSFRIPYREVYFSGGWVIVSILFLLALWLVFKDTKDAASLRREASATAGLSKAEWIFAGVLMLYPLYVVLASMMLGVFRYQYTVCFYVGFIVLIVASFAHLVRFRASAGVLALIAVAATVAVIHARSMVGGLKALSNLSGVHQAEVARVMSLPWVQCVYSQSLPVAVDANSYMKMTYYAPPGFRRRMYELVDEPDFDNPKFRLSITNQENFIHFSRMLPLHVMEIDDFLAQHPDFLVVTHFNKHEWLPAYLLKQQAQGKLSVKLLVLGSDRNVLEVQEK